MKQYKLLAVAIVLCAINLRAPFLVVTPILQLIRQEYMLDNSTMGLLTTIPLLVFAAFSPFVAPSAKKIGAGRLIFLSLLVMVCGEIVRYIFGEAGLFVGTLLLAVGIVVGNVMLPALIGAFYPKQIGLMTSIYSSAMQLVTGAVIAIILPLSLWIGWKNALLPISLITLFACLWWVPFWNLRLPDTNSVDKSLPLPYEPKSTKMLFKSALAWDVSLFMGIQSLVFYTISTWYPTILIDRGIAPTETGLFLLLFQLVSLCTSFITPIIVSRWAEQKWAAVFFCALYICGTIGTYAIQSYALAIFAAILLGLAAGGTFSIALIYFILRTSSPIEAATLSGIGQAIGYVLAAVGPILVGALYDYYHTWETSIVFIVGFCILFAIVGYRAGRDMRI